MTNKITELLLIQDRTQRYKLRMERLYDILRKRTAIESKMLAASKNVDDAYIFAEKMLSYALKRRQQGLTRHQNVRASKVMFVWASIDIVNRRSQHDLDPQGNNAASTT